MVAYFFITMIVFSIISVFALVTLNNNYNLSTSSIQDNSNQVHAGVIGAAILGAAIGAILGAFSTYRFALMIENRREKNQKEKDNELRKRYVLLIKNELDLYTRHLTIQYNALGDENDKQTFYQIYRHLLTTMIK
jgi:hypothetical protein